ncbi:MAG: cyclic pyranopterin phosphate synthase MoaA [Eggerthella sp. 51_9]|nr:MAG: cyclic pyranopterin phosphate synthase MoaA [Eggerthella sp. 51_9]
MKDGQGRQIDYLRISLTDRCNLRCIYCMPEHGVKSIPHESVLTLEEVHKAIECASQLGIKHIRFTGGEPTVRKGLLSLIERTAQTPGIESVALTTNAILLPGMAADLKAAGLSRVNISLDTLDAEQYRFITRLGNLDDALKGIKAALSAGLFPVKLNTVVVRSYVRFIEYMPIGNGDDCGGCGWGPADVVPAKEIIETISAQAQSIGLGSLQPAIATPDGWGPAQYYRLPGAQGTVGVISAISNHFCASCNRLRLTADGKIKPCLFSDTEYDIRSALRKGSEEEVLSVFKAALFHKPSGHEHRVGTRRMMSQVGG